MLHHLRINRTVIIPDLQEVKRGLGLFFYICNMARVKKRKAVMPKMKMGVHKSRSGGLTAKGVAAYRRANPGSKLKTAVTESNPKGKRAGRRKSFCSRMCGMKKRLTSAKTSRDPNSRINKALRKWRCRC